MPKPPRRPVQQCPLPTEAALNEQEMQLMRNMMGRVDRLARAAADVS